MQQLATLPDFVVRPLETSAERDEYYRLAIQTFNPHVDVETTLPRRRRFVEDGSTYHPGQLRGAFLGNTFLGGYHIDERFLCAGASRLLTGCIGGVVTIAAYRNQGVATALLRDMLTYSQQRKQALLLLNGIPNFYHRFGFLDVFDPTEHTIDSKLIQDQHSDLYHVRGATLDEVPALLELYQRHYGSYTGSFVRDLAYQELLYRYRTGSPLLALSPDNVPHGYLLLNQRPPDRSTAYEVAADNWPAALALLQHHATLNVQLNPQNHEITWPLPANSLTFYLLADHLSIRSQAFHNPNADWMARAAHLPTLMEALLPLWNERWLSRPRTTNWSSTLAISIDDETYTLEITSTSISLSDTSASHRMNLSQQALMQLLFGYRPTAWIAQQSGQHIPSNLHPILDVLFPTGHTWIPGSDAF